MALRKIGPVGYQNIKTYVSEGAVSRGIGVKVGANEGGAAAVAAAGAAGIGIANEDCVDGGALSVTREGDAVAIAGSAGTQGQLVKFNATGQVIPVVRGAGTSEEVIGRLESNPTQAGDECIVFVSPFTLTTPA